MLSKKVTLAALCLAFFGTSLQAAEGYVDVPAEFYFGRWAQGHYARDSVRYDSYADSLISRFSYQFSNARFSLGFTSLKDYLFLDHDDENNGFSTSDFHAAIRPRRNWQIGISDLWYAEQKGTSGYIQRLLRLKASSDWYSADRFRLNRRQAAYSYRFTTWIPAGKLALRNDFGLEFEQDDDGFRYEDYGYYGSVPIFEPSRSTEYYWKTSSALTAGITSRVNAWARLDLDYVTQRVASYGSGSFGNPPQTSYFFRDDFSKSYKPGLHLGAIVNPVDGFYLSLNAGQNYSSGSQAVYTYTTPGGSLDTPQETEKDKSAFMRTSASVEGRITYLSLGDFQAPVFLDDYSGYYWNLLFDSQVELSLGGSYRHDDDVHGFDLESVHIDAHAAAGWGDHLQAVWHTDYYWTEVLSLIYPYINWELRPQTWWEYGAEIQVRSFCYRPGSGPGWERDSEYDVAFGPALEALQWIGSVRWDPPLWWDGFDNEADLFQFGLLQRRGDRTDWTLAFSIGLGRKIEAGMKQLIGDYPSGMHLDRYEYDLSARILARAKLRVRLVHVNLRHSDRPTAVAAIIQILL